MVYIVRYTQRPDRKGTESSRGEGVYHHKRAKVTLKDPIERGLKVLCSFNFDFLHKNQVTLKDPIERGLKGAGTGFPPAPGYRNVTLKDPIERGLKGILVLALPISAYSVTLKDPIERGLKEKL